MRTEPQQAKHNPVNRPLPEVNTGAMPRREVPSVDIPDPTEGGVWTPERDEIIPVAADPGADYLSDLKFMEEMVTVRLERSAEKNAAKMVPVWVNGRCEWFTIGVTRRVARKYIEVLARAQPYSVQTVIIPGTETTPPRNHHIKPSSMAFPMSISGDSDKGNAWLEAILLES